MQFQINHHAPIDHARTGLITLPHGPVRTPAFMPVGTAGTVKGIWPDQVQQLRGNLQKIDNLAWSSGKQRGKLFSIVPKEELSNRPQLVP